MRQSITAGLLVLCLGIGSARAASGAGTLTAVRGEVWVQPSGAKEIAAQPGRELAPGTRIRTAGKGEADILLPDGTNIRLQANSALMLSGAKRHKSAKTSVLLFFGRVWSKVARRVTTDSAYEINTPNAVCGVRGTEFETAVGDDGSIRVRVSEGNVEVGEGEDKEAVAAGQEVEADESGIEDAEATSGSGSWEQWHEKKRERLRKGGRAIVDNIKGRIMSRKDQVAALRAEQKNIEAQRQRAEERARQGDQSAIQEIRRLNQQLASIADAIADLADATGSQFGIVDRFADLAADPRFNMLDRKYLEAEATSLRRIKAMFDAMVAEGTDISIEAMDRMLDDMSGGKRGSLKDSKGSTGDDLFGGDDLKR